MYEVYLGISIFAIIFAVGFFVYEQFAGDTDADIDNDSFEIAKLFSIKAVTGFLIGFGLGGLQAIESGLTGGDVTIRAFMIGSLFYILMIILIFLVNKLKTKEHIDVNSAIGNIGTVTISIRANSVGKINVKIGEVLREIKAKTFNDEDVSLGEQVKVIGIQSDSILIVEKTK